MPKQSYKENHMTIKDELAALKDQLAAAEAEVTRLKQEMDARESIKGKIIEVLEAAPKGTAMTSRAIANATGSNLDPYVIADKAHAMAKDGRIIEMAQLHTGNRKKMRVFMGIGKYNVTAG